MNAAIRCVSYIVLLLITNVAIFLLIGEKIGTAVSVNAKVILGSKPSGSGPIIRLWNWCVVQPLKVIRQTLGWYPRRFHPLVYNHIKGLFQ